MKNRTVITVLFFACYVFILFMARELKPFFNSRVEVKLASYAIIVILFYVFFRHRDFKLSLRLKYKVQQLKFIIPVLLIVGVYTAYSMNFFRNDYQLQSAVWVLLLMTLIQTFGEEIIFRGLVLNELFEKWSIKKASFVSSILFGLFHLMTLARTSEIGPVLNQVVVAIGLGYFLAALFVVSKNILIPSFAHFLINLPSYFKNTAAVAETQPAIVEQTTFIQGFMGLIFVFLLYSPFYIIGFLLMKTVKQEPLSLLE